MTLKSSQYTTVTGTSQKFSNAMDAGQRYRFAANTDCWVLVGATDAEATAGAGSHFVAKGNAIPLGVPPGDDGTLGFVHVIRDAADGKASLSLIGGAG